MFSCFLETVVNQHCLFPFPSSTFCCRAPPLVVMLGCRQRLKLHILATNDAVYWDKCRNMTTKSFYKVSFVYLELCIFED